MSIVTARALCKVVAGKWVNGEKDVRIKGIMSKCALVKPGMLYFDVKGGEGGNRNILEALKNGAEAVIISKHKRVLPFDNNKIAVIAVPKVWDAFWTSVKYYRDMYDIPVVGVTGTSGKTTTKEMITSIFKRRWKTMQTIGNLNLPTFVPSHIMRLRAGYEAAVFEIGMNRPGQISKQAKVIQPQVAVITHIGTGHVEYFGSWENVILEKAGIIEGLSENSHLILNSDDPATAKIDLSGYKGRVLYYSLSKDADFKAENIKYEDNGTSFTVKLDNKLQRFFIPTFGKHNVYNATAAIAVAHIFNFDVKSIKKGLAIYRKPKMRLQMVPGINNTRLINDTYNANPDSVIAGLEVLSTLAKGVTGVAVLGNMLEQGDFSRENHYRVGERAGELKIDWLVTVGGLAKEMAKGAAAKSSTIKIWSFMYKHQAITFLKANLPRDSVVLIKGSRGSYMERIVNALKDEAVQFHKAGNGTDS